MLSLASSPKKINVIGCYKNMTKALESLELITKFLATFKGLIDDVLYWSVKHKKKQNVSKFLELIFIVWATQQMNYHQI